MTDLQECRKEIDNIDKEIMTAFRETNESLRERCRIQDTYRQEGTGSSEGTG